MLAPLSDGVLEHARRRAGAPALVWRGEPITYGGLGEMVHRARAQLESLELPEHASVGVPARKSPQTIALVLACLMARRPVLLPSVDLGPETVRELLGQARCSHSLSAGEDGTVGSAATTGEATRSEDDPTSARSPRPDDVALMLTTSGSTGVPKIVPLSHGALDRFTAWAAARFDIAAGRTVLNYAPLNFDLCLLDVWTTLRYGGCVALVDPDRATRPDYLLDLLTSNDVDVVQAVPMLYGLLLDAARDGERELPGIEHVLVTGDSFPARSLAALSDLFPRSRFYNVYGCTETNDSFIHEIDLACGRPDGRIPIGSPLPGVDAVIVTAEDRVVAGPGTGELLVTTPFQTRGYLSQPLNDGRFVPHPEGTDARTYFRTGDIVRRHADGSITLEGRTDCHVKVRGIRVNTLAVEQVLLEHDQVLEAAVVPVPDGLAGHRLHAVARGAETSQLNSLSLRRHCARSLNRAAVPSTMEIVTVPLPKTPTGKVDRQRTIERHPTRRTHD